MITLILYEKGFKQNILINTINKNRLHVPVIYSSINLLISQIFHILAVAKYENTGPETLIIWPGQ